MDKISIDDFVYPSASSRSAQDRFDKFQSVVENLQDSVGAEASINLDESNPFEDALAYLDTAIDDSGLSQKEIKFLRSAQNREVMESAAERIVGVYYRRVNR